MPESKSKTTRSSQLTSALGGMLAGNLFIGVMNFFTQVAFARILGPEIIADYAIVIVAVNLIQLFTVFGVNHAVIGLGFTAQRFYNSLALLALQVLLMLAVGAVALLALAAWAPVMLGRLWLPGSIVFFGNVLLTIANVLNSEIEAELEYTKLSAMRAAGFVVANLAAGLLVYLGQDRLVMPGRDFFNCLTFIGLSLFFLRQPLALAFDRPVLRELVVFTRDVWLNNLSTEGNRRLDFAIVAGLLGPLPLAIYFQVRNLFEGTLAFVAYPIQSAVFAYLRRHREAIIFGAVLTRALQITAVLAVTGVVFFLLLGHPILGLLLGPKWQAGTVVMPPMAGYAAIIICFEILVSMTKALNAMRPILIARLTNLVAIGVLVTVFASRYGMNGAGWATMAAAAIMLSVGAWLAWPTLKDVNAVPLPAPPEDSDHPP